MTKFLGILLFFLALGLHPLDRNEDAEASQPCLKILLVNQTGSTITDLRISPSEALGWGEDVLEGEELDDLDERTIVLRGNSSTWDFSVADADGWKDECLGVPLASATWILVRRLGRLEIERNP